MTVALPDDFCMTTRTSPGYLLRRAYQLLVLRTEPIFTDGDLTITQWIALKLIRDGMADTSARLANQLGHNSGATTRMIDQIEERGWLTRHRQSDDRRVVKLALTPAGIAATAAMIPAMQDLWDDLLVDFAPADIATLVDLLSRLVARMERDDSA